MTSIHIFLIVIFVFSWQFCLLAAGSGSQAAESQALRVPLQVPIFVIAEANTDPTALQKLQDETKRALADVLPIYSPGTAYSPSNNNDILFHMEYSIRIVNSAKTGVLESYKQLVLGSPQVSPLKGMEQESRFYAISPIKLAAFLKQHEHHFSGPSFSTIPIVIVIAPSLPGHTIGDPPQRCSSSYVNRVAFIDFSAKDCVESISSSFLTPKFLLDSRRFQTFIEGGRQSVMRLQSMTITAANAKTWSLIISSAATSAVHSFAIGNAASRPSLFSNHIYIPIIVLKNGGVYDGDSDNSSSHSHHAGGNDLNVYQFENWLYSTLFPQQHVTILSTTYHVDEHPQLGVAFTSSQLAYTDKVSSARQPAEDIAYIDSAVLVHELLGISDRLCNQLLLKSGFNSDIEFGISSDKSSILNAEDRKTDLKSQQLSTAGSKKKKNDNKNTPLVLEKASASKPLKVATNKGEDSARQHSNLVSTSGSLHHQVSVLPVFVISDLHVHNKRSIGGSNSKKGKDNVGKGTSATSQHLASLLAAPVQPLFEKDFAVVVKENSLFVLHSSDPSVVSYSRSQHRWMPTNISDMQSLVAEGLAKLITGVNAPHSQREDISDVIDTTWAYGNHPFKPYGQLQQMTTADGRKVSDVVLSGRRNDDRNSFDDIVTWSAKRTMAVSKGLAIHRRVRALHDDMTRVRLWFMEAALVLKTMKRASVEVISDENSFKEREKLDIAETAKGLRLEGLESEIRTLDEQIGHIDGDLTALQGTFIAGEFEEIAHKLRDMGATFRDLELRSLMVANNLQDQLSDCKVSFEDLDDQVDKLAVAVDHLNGVAQPLTVQERKTKRIEHKQQQQRQGTSRWSVSGTIGAANNSTWGSVRIWVVLVGFLGMLAMVARISDGLSSRAKKLK